jgi:hypothetical protein
MKQVRVSLSLLVVTLVLLSMAVGTAVAASQHNFTASLKGRAEVPAVHTNAQGQAIFHLSRDGTALQYKLIVANIENVTQAHIHCAAEGVNGPVVAFLYGLNAAGVTVNGILAEGTLTAANVIARPDSAACPGGVATFDDLIAKIRSGDAYVNVHTLAYPAGEVRGQIR